VTTTPLIVIDKAASAVNPALLVALTVKLVVVLDATAENPEITPLPEFKLAPAGNEPTTTLYDTVAAPGPGLALTVNVLPAARCASVNVPRLPEDTHIGNPTDADLPYP
jgi:hypothetical protein